MPLHRTQSLALRSVVLALLLPLPAAGPAAAAACSGLGPSAAVMCEISVERSARDLPLLQMDDRLALAAGRHARHMVRSGFFSHVAPGGDDAGEPRASVRLHRPGAPWAVGEVLAWGRRGSGSPDAIVAALDRRARLTVACSSVAAPRHRRRRREW